MQIQVKPREALAVFQTGPMTATKKTKQSIRPRKRCSSPSTEMTVARFRDVFPNAGWSDAQQAWTVPGKTARKRTDRWLASKADRRTPYEGERGRDAYQFEPILRPICRSTTAAST